MMKYSILYLLTLLLLTSCSRPIRKGLNKPEPAPKSTLESPSESAPESTPEPSFETPSEPAPQPTSEPTAGKPLPKETGSFDAEMTTGGMTRQFRVHVPVNYHEDTPLALVLVFHGYTDTAEQVERQTAMSEKADWEGFFVVYPDGLNTAWSTGPGAEGEQDRQFIRDLISYLESQYSIDPRRIYATGISNGGGMADRLGCTMSDVFAAIAPVAGAYNFWKDCHPSRPVPVIAFHGLDDNIVPYDGGNSQAMVPMVEEWAASWAERNGCSSTSDISDQVNTVTVRTWSGCQQGADVVLYTIENHGHSWPGSPTMPKEITSQAVNANDVMWEFFKAHPMR